uniref:Uncharacterized protein n=1 Tax=Anopheles arabiensis TaxID=7173 RepID=A0A182IH99_ANOAR
MQKNNIGFVTFSPSCDHRKRETETYRWSYYTLTLLSFCCSDCPNGLFYFFYINYKVYPLLLPFHFLCLFCVLKSSVFFLCSLTTLIVLLLLFFIISLSICLPFCHFLFLHMCFCVLCVFSFSLFRCYVYDTVLFVSSFSHLFVVCFVPCNNVADHTMRHGTCLTFCLFPVSFFTTLY